MYRGQAILEGTQGTRGTLLLDPRRVTIVSGSDGANDNQLSAGTPSGSPANTILFADGGTADYTISESILEAATSNILIQATEAIIVDDLEDNVLSLMNGVSLVLQTRNSTATPAGDPEGIVFVDSADSIRASGTGGITLQAGVTAGSTGTVTARNGSAAINLGGLQAESGTILVEATGMVSVAGAVQTTGGQIRIQGDDLVLTGSITTSGNLLLQTQAGRSQAIGTATGDWTLDNSEIGRIQAASVTVGGAVTTGFTRGGNILVSGVTSGSNGIQSWTLDAVGLANVGNTAQVQFDPADSSFRSLTVRAVDGIRVDANITTTEGGLSFNPNSDNSSVLLGNNRLTIGAGRTLTSAGALTLTGATTGLGALGLNAAEGVTLAGATTVAGNVTIDADTDRNGSGTFSVTAGGLSTSGADVSVTSGDINLGVTPSINAGAGTVSLQASKDLLPMQVGGTTAQPGGWNLLATEVQRITAGTLIVGGTANGLLTVSALSSTNTTNLGEVILRSTGNGQGVQVDG
ncbi:MAG: beta strand repeat-containing protein, partial [Planctomycetaceae bacterium]